MLNTKGEEHGINVHQKVSSLCLKGKNQNSIRISIKIQIYTDIQSNVRMTVPQFLGIISSWTRRIALWPFRTEPHLFASISTLKFSKCLGIFFHHCFILVKIPHKSFPQDRRLCYTFHSSSTMWWAPQEKNFKHCQGDYLVLLGVIKVTLI